MNPPNEPGDLVGHFAMKRPGGCGGAESSQLAPNSVILYDNPSTWRHYQKARAAASGWLGAMGGKMYDFIIVGSGSSGAVLAARLSADPSVRVLVLEAGGSDRHPYVQIPSAFARLSGPRFNWDFETEPQAHLNQRRMYMPQGKLLGGGSSINAMVYIRGNEADYDGWAQNGNLGWSYRDVLPYFRRAEHNERLRDDFHGQGGPLNVCDPVSPSPLTLRFVDAAVASGLPRNFDFNGAAQEGAGVYQVTQKNGRRMSAARAYLRPAMGRSNLTVITSALVLRVVIEKGRAIGVEYLADGRPTRAMASQEVIVAAGAINSPKLLLLSGIGPADELRALGIHVEADLPGVGRNLQDHLDINIVARIREPISYNGKDRGLPAALSGLRWLLRRNGPATSNVAEGGGFTRSDSRVSSPDIQFHFLPAMVIEHGRVPAPGHGFTLHTNCLRPESRGFVRLKSSDPRSKPAVDPNYLSLDSDLRVLLAALKRGRDIINSPPLSAIIDTELHPGPSIRSDDELIAFIRRAAETDYHPVGACRMGVDAEAVVDPQLRVRGVERLRVCDSSIMPTLVSGNTNAPSIMIGEKGADIIAGASVRPVQVGVN
jgi:choline dehydrogenase